MHGIHKIFIATTLVCTSLLLPPVVAQQVTVITSDMTLQPNQNYGRLVIQASDITIDGNGTHLQGAKTSPTYEQVSQSRPTVFIGLRSRMCKPVAGRQV